MDKKRLLELAEKHSAKADTAFRNYQETGITRYSTAWHREEELADALRIAAASVEDHMTLVHLRANVAEWISRATDLKYKPDISKEKASAALLVDLIAYGKLMGLMLEV